MPKIKNIIIFTVIAGVFVLAYVFFIKKSPEQANLVSSGAGALPNIDGSVVNTNASNKNSLITKDFLAVFSNIKNIKLDDAIFSDPAFVSLHDSSITLVPDGNEGRPNPFAQFGNDNIPPAPVSAPSISQNSPNTTSLSAPLTNSPVSPTLPISPAPITTMPVKR